MVFTLNIYLFVLFRSSYTYSNVVLMKLKLLKIILKCYHHLFLPRNYLHTSKTITLKRKKNIENLECCDETWFHIFKLPKLEFNENVSEKLF